MIQSRFVFFAYFIIRVLGFPFLVLYFLYRGGRDGRYFSRFQERLGHLPDSFHRTLPGCIWLHAVSVGEVISGVRLIEELRKTNPSIPIYLSTTTLAGRAVAEQKLREIVDGIFFSPIDYGFVVRRVIRTIRPAVVIVLETEIWPVLYHEAKRALCGLMVLNGRISDRAFPRYRRFRWIFAPVLALPDAILVQSDKDARRYLEAAAPVSSVRVFGNLKYDAAVAPGTPPEFVAHALAALQPAQIWIAASTMPGRDAQDGDEDDIVIGAFQQLSARFPGLLLILAPRHPERFDLAASKLRQAGLASFRRSANRIPDGFVLPGVLLLDTIGELASLFPAADVVFMGGTLARRGGHNVLEPAVCAKPIIVGPHMENFADIASSFEDAGAWLSIPDGDALAGAVEDLLREPGDLGHRAANVARQSTGVAARAAREITAAQDRALPQWNGAGPLKPLLWALAKAWEAGSRRKQRRDGETAQALERPVISVGGIAMGGTGKTPFVAWLTERLRARGLQPAILTRGYRRRSVDKTILIRAGSSLSTWYTGDEAQIFVRAGLAHLGIGADRWSTGRMVEEKFHPDVFVLDDGFQHNRLRRNLDIVLIDALNPFAGGEVFPLGYLREPMEGLRRADVFVITRAQPGRQYSGIRAELRKVNPAAPVFLASVIPQAWQSAEPAMGPVAAFCGLGNPDTFWQTLHEQGFNPVFTWTFGDHHRYRPRELQRLAYQAKVRGLNALLTTEKDAMNLPPNAQELVAPLEIYWLKIGTVVEEEAALLALIWAACAGGSSQSG